MNFRREKFSNWPKMIFFQISLKIVFSKFEFIMGGINTDVER